jgi:hypothetical protein
VFGVELLGLLRVFGLTRTGAWLLRGAGVTPSVRVARGLVITGGVLLRFRVS